MTRLLFLSILLFGQFVLLSCGQKANSKKVTEFYGLIHSSFIFSKDAQQKFVDKAAQATYQIRNDSNAVIDTKELRLLLDSAKQASQIRQAIIKDVQEVDNEIDFKNKVYKYIDLFNSAYDNEFEQFINILGSDTDNKFEKISTLLKPKLIAIKEAGDECDKAGNEFRTKYEIQVDDHNN